MQNSYLIQTEKLVKIYPMGLTSLKALERGLVTVIINLHMVQQGYICTPRTNLFQLEMKCIERFFHSRLRVFDNAIN